MDLLENLRDTMGFNLQWRTPKCFTMFHPYPRRSKYGAPMWPSKSMDPLQKTLAFAISQLVEDLQIAIPSCSTPRKLGQIRLGQHGDLARRAAENAAVAEAVQSQQRQTQMLSASTSKSTGWFYLIILPAKKQC